MTNQLHDYTPGVSPSGLFWTARLPDDSVSRVGNTITIVVEDLDVVDTFQVFSGIEVPATVSFDITWSPVGPMRHLRPGSNDPMDPTNFAAELRDAVATGTFSGSSVTELGGGPFSFTGDAVSVWAEMGKERNGVFTAPKHNPNSPHN